MLERLQMDRGDRPNDEATARLWSLLSVLYDPKTVEEWGPRFQKRLQGVARPSNRASRWSETDLLLIAYPDSFQAPGQVPLQSLRSFLTDRLPKVFSQVHLLPFYPYTSDDGFAVKDYQAVDPAHGEWADIRDLSGEAELMFDFVINHGSSAHPRFLEFLEDRPPGNRYFVTAPEELDVSGVTRPRASPLLQRYETARGDQWVWCTFSRDQVDWDFANPEVLYEFIDLLVNYLERGATWLRIDAVAYLWKQAGTNCVHLPEVHAVVKLIRFVGECVSEDVKILTETNVPLAENLSYFGEGDEAHIVYNFSLPPILTHALLTGDGRRLTQWCRSLPELPEGCTYLNFTASHDGIGLRPAEGILNREELGQLVGCVQASGGLLTQRSRPDGSVSPYEANIALFDLLGRDVEGPDAWQIERFLMSQAVMLAFEGVPAVYYNSILASSNHVEGFKKTGRNRTLNRKKWTLSEVDARLSRGERAQAKVFARLKEMLEMRKKQAAFHPECPQRCLVADPRLFVLVRGAAGWEQQLLCVFNLSKDAVTVDKSDLGLDPEVGLENRFSQGEVDETSQQLCLSPYAMAWLELVS
ncbi:MAG: sugar phosphorylase [Myxococcota bacterium]|nr:sugar phosphorylase [Myxococcota bacterium]